eukprot:scaffold9290_cov107-Cylindrotheca_fusiformis.AAC.1
MSTRFSTKRFLVPKSTLFMFSAVHHPSCKRTFNAFPPNTASTAYVSHRPIVSCSYETPALASQIASGSTVVIIHRDNIR